MRTLRNLLLFLLVGAAAIGLIAVAYIDPPAPTRAIEAEATLPGAE
ncbi:MAG: hypothetical protein AAGM38_14625 [Pseudomonadota bacterium]